MPCAFFKDGAERVTKVKNAALVEGAAFFLCFYARSTLCVLFHPILTIYHAGGE